MSTVILYPKIFPPFKCLQKLNPIFKNTYNSLAYPCIQFVVLYFYLKKLNPDINF